MSKGKNPYTVPIVVGSVLFMALGYLLIRISLATPSKLDDIATIVVFLVCFGGYLTTMASVSRGGSDK